MRHSVLDAAGRRTESVASHAYAAELEHFHDCVVDGARCLTPARQAAKDIAVLRDLYVRQPLCAA